MHVLRVSEYLVLVNTALRACVPEDCVVEGEVADFKVSQGKWVNFDLKDEKAEAKIACFMTTFQLQVPLASGMRIQARGVPKVFERFGKFSLNVEEVTLVGEGVLQKAYAALKKKLQDEGLFDVGRKRALPRFPLRIGLITSKEAAAYGDFLRILGNRFGGLTIMHIPVHVQGQHAVPEILAAFETFNRMSIEERPEVLVLTRGGGSLEELHAFNDEAVARAVFASVIPVIVGVGHERDESLCDFVADVRASTPSNAAERLISDRREMLRDIAFSLSRIDSRYQALCDRPRDHVARAMMMFDHFFVRLRDAVLAQEKTLASVDPLRVLARGYAVVRKGGVVMRDPRALAPGDPLTVQLAAGELGAIVAGIKEEQPRLL